MKLYSSFVIWIVCFLSLTGCSYRYDKSVKFETEYSKRAFQKSDTLVVKHSECTECSDLYIIDGKLTVPLDLTNLKEDSSLRDIKVCGNFPIDFCDVIDFDFDAGAEYKIIGKIILADTSNAIGSLSVFYTEYWSKLK